MSAKAKKDVICYTFEPQTWRKNVCKNCFKTKDQHAQAPESKLNQNDGKTNECKKEQEQLPGVESKLEVKLSETKENDKQSTDKGQIEKKLSSASVELKAKVPSSKDDKVSDSPKILRVVKQTEKKDTTETGTAAKISGTKAIKINLDNKTLTSTTESDNITTPDLSKTDKSKVKTAGITNVKSISLKTEVDKPSDDSSKISTIKVKTKTSSKAIKTDSNSQLGTSLDKSKEISDTKLNIKESVTVSDNIPKTPTLDSISDKSKLAQDVQTSDSDKSWMKSKVKPKTSDESWMKSKSSKSDPVAAPKKKKVVKKSVKSEKTEIESSGDKDITSLSTSEPNIEKNISTGIQKQKKSSEATSSVTKEKCDKSETSSKTDPSNDASALLAWLSPKKDTTNVSDKEEKVKKEADKPGDIKSKTKGITKDKQASKSEPAKDKQDSNNKVEKQTKLDNKPQDADKDKSADVSTLMSWLTPKKDTVDNAAKENTEKSKSKSDTNKVGISKKDTKEKEETEPKARKISSTKLKPKETKESSEPKPQDSTLRSKSTESGESKGNASALLAYLTPKKNEDKTKSEKDIKNENDGTTKHDSISKKTEPTPKKIADESLPTKKETTNTSNKDTKAKSKPDVDKNKSEDGDASALLAWLTPKKDEKVKDLAKDKKEPLSKISKQGAEIKKELDKSAENKMEDKNKPESISKLKETDSKKIDDKTKKSKPEKKEPGSIDKVSAKSKSKTEAGESKSEEGDASALLAWLAPKKGETAKDEVKAKSEDADNKFKPASPKKALSDTKKPEEQKDKDTSDKKETTKMKESRKFEENTSTTGSKKTEDKIKKNKQEKKSIDEDTAKSKSEDDKTKTKDGDASALLAWLSPKKEDKSKEKSEPIPGKSEQIQGKVDQKDATKASKVKEKLGSVTKKLEEPTPKEQEEKKATIKSKTKIVADKNKPDEADTSALLSTKKEQKASQDKNETISKKFGKTIKKTDEEVKEKASPKTEKKTDMDITKKTSTSLKGETQEDKSTKKSKFSKDKGLSKLDTTMTVNEKEPAKTEDKLDSKKQSDADAMLAWLSPKVDEKKGPDLSGSEKTVEKRDSTIKPDGENVAKVDTKSPVSRDKGETEKKVSLKDSTTRKGINKEETTNDKNKSLPPDSSKNIDKTRSKESSDAAAMLAWLTPGKATADTKSDDKKDVKKPETTEPIKTDEVKKSIVKQKSLEEDPKTKKIDKPKSKLASVKSKFQTTDESEQKPAAKVVKKVKKVKKEGAENTTEKPGSPKIESKAAVTDKSSNELDKTGDFTSKIKSKPKDTKESQPMIDSAAQNAISTKKEDTSSINAPKNLNQTTDSINECGKSVAADKNTPSGKPVSDAVKPPVLSSDRKLGESKITQQEPKQTSAEASRDVHKSPEIKTPSAKKPPNKTESDKNTSAGALKTEEVTNKVVASGKDTKVTKLEAGSNSFDASAGKCQVPATVGVSSPVTDSSSSEGSAQVKNKLSSSPSKQSKLSSDLSLEDDDHITKPGYFRDMLREFEDIEVKSFRKMEDESKKDTAVSQQTPAASTAEETTEPGLSRSEAMMEANRILVDNLRNKVGTLEEKCERLEKEKSSYSESLNIKKHELSIKTEDYGIKLKSLEEKCTRLDSENSKLLEKIKLPDAERSLMKDQQDLIESFQKRVEDADNKVEDIMEENISLRHEIKDQQLEMEEMHDQFREDEAIEFRELQKELEATAKNCRILQFKLRKAERRSEQTEQEKMQIEERLRHKESQGEGRPTITLSDSEQATHLRELEEELKMAKEVSVRLHDELEMVEERRLKSEDELERVTDYLRESEGRRAALQREINTLHEEMDNLSDELEEYRESKGLPPRPSLSRQASAEAEVTQHKRDLEDSLERENDLKEQLRYSEEENKIIRKKAADIEEENESLNLQLKKMSSAKSGRFFRKKTEPPPVLPDSEGPDLQLQFELAEQEIKVLKRKISDMEQDNDNLLSEVKFLQHKLGEAGKPQVKTHGKFVKVRGMLKKSRSLDSEGSSFLPDPPRPLTLPHPEISSLKIKIQMLEELNGNLILENKKMQENNTRPVPSIQADDAAVRNIELMDRIKKLEEENNSLREKLKSLDEKTHKISREITKTDSPEIRDLREKLRLVEEESTVLRKKMGELEELNSRLGKDLKRQGSLKGRDKTKTDNGEREGEEQLKEKVAELESEVADLLLIVKNREDETERLEAEIKIYQSDMENMFDAFKDKEKHLNGENENLQQKNNVLSTLLDLVTDRAESTQRELDKLQEGSSERRRSERSQSAVSDVSLGSDEVFSGGPQSPPTSAEGGEKSDKEKKIVNKNWQEQFQKRIICLEMLLMEERERVHATEKKLSLQDSQLSGQQGDIQLNEREKDIMRQELDLSQKELEATSEYIIQLKARIQELTETNECLKKEYENLAAQKESEKTADKKGKTTVTKEPSSWRFEKEQLQTQLKDLQKQLKFKGIAVKEKEVSLPDNDSDKWKNKYSKLEEQLADLDNKLKELNKERSKLEEGKILSEKEASQKREIILEKDNIIRQKDELIKQKDSAIKERDDSLKQREVEFKKLNETIVIMKKKENELIKLKDQITVLESLIQEKESNLKTLNENIRQRDGRLKEKDEILQRLNEKLNKKDTEHEKHAKKGKSTDEMKKLNSRLKEADEKLQKLDKEKAKEINNLILQREKSDKQLEKLHKEKDCLEADLKKAKDNLKSKDDKLRKERDKLELELIQVKDKLHSMEVIKSMKSSDALKTLSSEKNALLNDKLKLENDLCKINKQVDENIECWNSERDELQNIIRVKTKMLDDNGAICEKMQMEIDRLKYQISASQVHHQISHVTKSESDEQLDNKVHQLKEQLSQAMSEIVTLRNQVQNQTDLMNLSARTFQDLKARMESDNRRWDEERASFDKSLKYHDSYQKKMSDLQKDLDSVKVKLSLAESRNKELETSLEAEKTSRKAGLVTGSKATKVSEATAPWSTAGHAKMKWKQMEVKSAGGSDVAHEDQSKTVASLQKVMKELQEKVRRLSKSKEEELKEWSRRMEGYREDWDEQRVIMVERNNKLEEQVKHLSEFKKVVLELQCKLRESTERWNSEKYHLERQLNETKRIQLLEKQRLQDLVAQTHKLVDVNPMLLDLQQHVKTEETKQQLKTTVEAIEEILRQTRRKSPDVEKYHTDVSYKPTSCTTATFTRSHSSDTVLSQSSEPIEVKHIEKGQETQLDETRRARPLMRRSQTAQITTSSPRVEPKSPELTITATRGRHTYASGTRSAFCSRDASPEKAFRMKLPNPPPSFIISPSHGGTRKAFTADTKSQTGPLTSQDMEKLCNRLSEIESPESDVNQNKSSKRLLIKSVSVDSSVDDTLWVPMRPEDSTGFNYDKGLPQMHSYSPSSQKLPIQGHTADQLHIPGKNTFDRKSKVQESIESRKLSPRTVRRKFFDEYDGNSANLSGYMSLPERKSKSKKVKEMKEKPLASIQIRGGKVVTVSDQSGDESPASSPSKTSIFFSSSKERRKLFGAKKSHSLDSSAVGSCIARVGVQVMKPAAPSTYAPPAVPEVPQKKSLSRSSSGGDVRRSPSPFSDPSSPGGSVTGARPLQVVPSDSRPPTDNTGTK